MIPEIQNLKHKNSGAFFLFAGPCVIEGEEMAFRIAEKCINITDTLKIPYVFKGSFKKANRSRIDSFTGIGDEKALKILDKIRNSFNIPVVTDIHSPEDAVMAAEYVDVLQIPAFLCRQTDLLVAAAKTGKFINIKKGQFLSPQAMAFAVSMTDPPPTGNRKSTFSRRPSSIPSYTFRSVGLGCIPPSSIWLICASSRVFLILSSRPLRTTEPPP